MGTYVELTFVGVPAERANDAAEAAFAEFDRLDRSMSEWRPDSQLTRVNAAAGGSAIPVDAELFDLVVVSLDLAAKSGGAFDPTFAALWGLWTFGDDGVDRVPNRDQVEARAQLIGWAKVEIDRQQRTIRLPRAGMKLGLGGIAKGYATDRAVAILRAHGMKDFLIKAGGELYAAGKNGAEPWRIGVRDPRGPGYFVSIDLEDEAFDTSGDYERFFVADGARYHHIIDPKTGYPATASRSATVLAKDATTADALSTALFVLGPEKGMMLVESMPGIAAVIVGADNGVAVSKGLKERLINLRPPTP